MDTKADEPSKLFPPAGSGVVGAIQFGAAHPAEPKRRGRRPNGAAGAPKVRGRKDQSSKQEAVIEAAVVKTRVGELVLLLQRSKDAANAYGDAVKATAEKSGLQAAVVRKFVEARASDHYEERSRDARQLVLLFDEVGE